jgi:hypothetical protein
MEAFNDCAVGAYSQHLGNLHSGVRKIGRGGNHLTEPSDIGAILYAVADNPVLIVVHSPVDVEIADSLGRAIAKDRAEIPLAEYQELDEAVDGASAQILIPFPLGGDYQVAVLPKTDAQPTDTYTIELDGPSGQIIIADNVRVEDVPPGGHQTTINPRYPIQGMKATVNPKVGAGSMKLSGLLAPVAPVNGGLVHVAVGDGVVQVAYDLGVLVQKNKAFVIKGNLSDGTKVVFGLARVRGSDTVWKVKLGLTHASLDGFAGIGSREMTVGFGLASTTFEQSLEAKRTKSGILKVPAR